MDEFYYTVNEKYYDEYGSYIKKARAICDELNLPVSKNVQWELNYAYKSYGQCFRTNDNSFMICINRVYFKKSTPKYKRYLLSTIVHELIHTIDFKDSHGKVFMKYADIVNEKYNDEYGDFITKLNDSHIINENAKYILKCSNCGELFYYHRICQDVRDSINGTEIHNCGTGKGWGMINVERIRR